MPAANAASAGFPNRHPHDVHRHAFPSSSVVTADALDADRDGCDPGRPGRRDAARGPVVRAPLSVPTSHGPAARRPGNARTPPTAPEPAATTTGLLLRRRVAAERLALGTERRRKHIPSQW